MSAKYTITVESTTDNTKLRHRLYEIQQGLQTFPKVTAVRLDFETARGRAVERMEHNPIVWRKPKKAKKKAKLHKVLNPYYVWCDKYGGIHDNTLNPEGYIEDGNQDYCTPDLHRAVFVQSEDPDEEF